SDAAAAAGDKGVSPGKRCHLRIHWYEADTLSLKCLGFKQGWRRNRLRFAANQQAGRRRDRDCFAGCKIRNWSQDRALHPVILSLKYLPEAQTSRRRLP